jgi:hypothetical protein
MKFLKHMSENLFITFTGIAALVHSTWSLGTMFSGQAPDAGDWLAYAGWVLPAFFVAFAMDVGQISTSAAIRHNGLTWQRGLAFFVFAVATYYLQFLYIAHHMPALPIATGVSDFHQWTVVTARDAAIWILPLLLPLSTMLYTISDGDNKEQVIEPPFTEPTITLITPEISVPLLFEEQENKISGNLMLEEEIIKEPKYPAHCADCGWEKEYENPATANRALKTHKSVHCPAKALEQVGENIHAD